MEQDTVKSIKKELLSNERKLEESMSHTREISKLISVIEKAIEAKEGEISGLKSRLSLTKDTLTRTEKELSESRTSARKRGEDVDRLQGQLASERGEVRLVKSQLETANKQLSSLHSDLSETRATAWRRKEELDSLNNQVREMIDQIMCEGDMCLGDDREGCGQVTEGDHLLQGEDDQGA